MYHVLLQMCPDDCMGTLIKDYSFDSHDEARSFYNRPFISLAKVKEQISDLYGDYEDGEEWFRRVTCDVILIECDTNIYELQEFDCIYHCEGWMNNFDGIAFQHCGITLQEIYDKFGAVTESCYWMDFSVDDKSISVEYHEADENVCYFNED